MATQKGEGNGHVVGDFAVGARPPVLRSSIDYQLPCKPCKSPYLPPGISSTYRKRSRVHVVHVSVAGRVGEMFGDKSMDGSRTGKTHRVESSRLVRGGRVGEERSCDGCVGRSRGTGPNVFLMKSIPSTLLYPSILHPCSKPMLDGHSHFTDHSIRD